MRALLQRVQHADVRVDGELVGKIDRGWLVLLGVRRGDTRDVARWLAEKCVHLRAFPDEQGKMNRSVSDVSGAMLIVSQFTLYGDCQRGRRPGFDAAAPPELAEPLYEAFCEAVLDLGVPVERGVFRADMQVGLTNDGPVTFLLERDAVSPSSGS